MLKALIFTVIVIALTIGVYSYFKKYKPGHKIVTGFNCLIACVFLITLILFCPVFYYLVVKENLCWFWKGIKAWLLSLQMTFQVFTINTDSSVITDTVPDAYFAYERTHDKIEYVYSLLLSGLYVFAPMLTFAFVLSFFKNIVSLIRLRLAYITRKDIYVFSELNEKSLTLAKSIKTQDEKAALVFNDVFEKNEELSYELIDEARDIKSILFKKDILAVHFNCRRKNKQLFFFTIGNDETENISQTLKLIEKYRDCLNTSIYVFSTRAECEIIIENADHGNLKVKKINEVRSLINRHLYDNGKNIFFKDLDYSNTATIDINELYTNVRFLINNQIYQNGSDYSDADIRNLRNNIYSYLDYLNKKSDNPKDIDKFCDGLQNYVTELRDCSADSEKFSDENIEKKRSELLEIINELRESSKCYEKIEGVNDYSDDGVRYTCDDTRSYIKYLKNYVRRFTFTDAEIDSFCDEVCSYMTGPRFFPQNLKYSADEVRSYLKEHLTLEGLPKLPVSFCPQEVLEGFYQSKNEETIKKTISAVIIGLGKHGTEMLKALSWYCQLPGYRLKIYAYDKKESIRDELLLQYPDLISGNYYGHGVFGDANYTINVKSGIDVYSDSFREDLMRITDVSYVFICLGDDETNISTAVKLRSMYKGLNMEPVIESIVYSNGENSALKNSHNFRGKDYNINFIGSLDSMYSFKSIMNSELDNNALELHLEYSKKMNVSDEKLEKEKKKFWKYNYFYTSNISAAIHHKLRKDVNLPYSAEGSDAVKYLGCITEHNRWNAFIRSIGYTYGKKKNDLANKHHLLVPFDELPDREKIKDS